MATQQKLFSLWKQKGKYLERAMWLQVAARKPYFQITDSLDADRG